MQEKTKGHFRNESYYVKTDLLKPYLHVCMFLHSSFFPLLKSPLPSFQICLLLISLNQWQLLFCITYIKQNHFPAMFIESVNVEVSLDWKKVQSRKWWILFSKCGGEKFMHVVHNMLSKITASSQNNVEACLVLHINMLEI